MTALMNRILPQDSPSRRSCGQVLTALSVVIRHDPTLHSSSDLCSRAVEEQSLLCVEVMDCGAEILSG